LKTPGLCDDFVVESFAPFAHGREAALAGGGAADVAPSRRISAGEQPTITRSAAADGCRWLAADCALTPASSARSTDGGSDPSALRWNSAHQLWFWPHSGSSPALAPRYPSDGDPLTIVVADPGHSRIAVGSFYGFIHSPHLACVGGRRTRSAVGLYDCDSRPGDCGSLVLSRSGVVGLHAGTLMVNGTPYNAFYPFQLGNSEPRCLFQQCEAEVRHSGRHQGGGGSSAARASSAPRQRHQPAGPVRIVQTIAEHPRRESRAPVAAVPRPFPKAGRKQQPKRESGIVGMSPAPSTLPSRDTRAADGSTERYVEVLMNPWGAAPVRLPDHVVVPTSLARFVANRTLTITEGDAAYSVSNGPNLLFGLCNRLSPAQAVTGPTDRPIEVASVLSLTVAGSPPVTTEETFNTYTYSPGCILTPLQWGGSAYAVPTTAMYYDPSIPSMGVWGDDFGSSLATTVQFMSAYRTLSMAIRVRIIGLPSGQFMTPGKIYFAQVRCDHSDLPVTEQDFVTLEQLGRASHVSADAVREAGSKTVFYTPDSALKFSMTSNFLQPAGVFTDNQAVVHTAGGGGGTLATLAGPMRAFPGPSISAQDPAGPTMVATDFTRNIIPYLTTGNTSVLTGAVSDTSVGTSRAMGDAADSANADATTYLFVAYFGAAAGVVLELDYATVVEYIPTKSSPGGIEALVQLPDSRAMDTIFSAAAVLSEARPTMIQQPGDLTIASPMRGQAPSRESLAARRSLTSMAARSTGRSYREGFWDFDWLKKGSLGNGALNWDFSDGPRGGGGKR